MKKLRYPIGIQTFSNMIEGGYAYVDKTMYIPRLIDAAKFIFLSRPRRFGKSLTLSMMHSYFAGERELFKGLAVDAMDVEWVKRPVIHLDFNAEDYSNPEGLVYMLDSSLRNYEAEYGITEKEQSLSSRFKALISKAKEMSGMDPAILVDEYDKPLLNTEEYPQIFEKNQALLKGFFGVLKSMEKDIHFAMLTGVARFNKVSIFSDLNNLRDISMQNEFADICGWTHEELLSNFSEGIRRLAEINDLTYEQAISKMKSYYDGYRFTPRGNMLYNPFSVINALAAKELGRYWFQTGTPTFLVKRIINRKILLPSLNSVWINRWDLEAVGMNDSNPIPLLFQTGYLTIKEARGDRYQLHFPNEEVEFGFADNLTDLYLPTLRDYNGEFSIMKFEDDLLDHNPEQFMLRLQTLIRNVPYEKHDEQLYQNVVYLLFTLLGTDARMEEHSNRGRTDITVRMEECVYIFEFKYNRSAGEAMRQIHDREYARRFALSGKRIFLIGANFSFGERELENWIIEEI